MSSSDEEEQPTTLLQKHKKFKSEQDEARTEADNSRYITLKDFCATCHASWDASEFEDLACEPKSIFADFCPPSVGGSRPGVLYWIQWKDLSSDQHLCS